MPTTLVVGGPRSGATRYAASLLAHHDQVKIVTAPHVPAHTDIAERPQWRHSQTLNLTAALLSAREAVLVEGLDSWLWGILDTRSLWADPGQAHSIVSELADELALAGLALPWEIVMVSQELTWASAPPDSKELLHAELLTTVNARVSSAATRVHAIVAGRVMDLSDARAVQV